MEAVSNSRDVLFPFPDSCITLRLHRFWKGLQVDPDQIWVDLCTSGQQRAAAIQYCKTYLHFTATKTMRSRVVLGTEERQEKRAFRQASSLISLWKSTVLGANRTVLAQKRWDDPDNAARWTLKFGTGIVLNRGSGPINEIITVRPALRSYLLLSTCSCTKPVRTYEPTWPPAS